MAGGERAHARGVCTRKVWDVWGGVGTSEEVLGRCGEEGALCGVQGNGIVSGMLCSRFVPAALLSCIMAAITLTFVNPTERPNPSRVCTDSFSLHNQ